MTRAAGPEGFLAKPKPRPTREERRLRRGLEDLVEAVRVSLFELDAEMKQPADEKRGRNIAMISNALEYAKDRARFGALDIDFRTGKKRRNPRKKTIHKG